LEAHVVRGQLVEVAAMPAIAAAASSSAAAGGV
jgi:hypothetical protein